jgi:hypothetical protein
LLFKPGQQTRDLSFKVLADNNPEHIVKSLLDSIKIGYGPAVVGDVSGEATIVDDDGSVPPPPGTVSRVSVGNDGTEGDALQEGCGGSGPRPFG